MSQTTAKKSTSDNQSTSKSNIDEEVKSEKVEVQWLHPNMADQPKNENVPEETEPQKDNDVVSPSATSFFASAWSAWGKVENMAKTAAYSAAYSAGPEEADEAKQEKLEIDCDGNPIGLASDSNSQTEKEENSNTSEAGSSPKKENNAGFSNSPSLASISSLTTKSVGGFFSGLTSYVEENKEWVKSVAADATSAIKENVKVPDLQGMALPFPEIVNEFNREQQEFIKTKGDAESGIVNKPQEGLAPWIGYQEEDAMKAKILSLSADKRTFVRAPPSGVTFDFDYDSVSSTALALLKEDSKLSEMRYELVPKVVKEDEFWKNYFYRVNLIKQSFDLKDLDDDSSSPDKKNDKKDSLENRLASTGEELDEENAGSVHSHDADDEFVSESYQGATKKEMAEVNESMRRLGLGGGGGTVDDDAEVEAWEAELEGELNEFEVVSSKDGNEDPTDDMTEDQIQEMLDAEDGTSSTDSLKRK